MRRVLPRKVVLCNTLIWHRKNYPPILSVPSLQDPSTQAKPSQTKPNQTRPSQTKPSQTKPNQVKPNQTKPSQVKPDHVYSSTKRAHRRQNLRAEATDHAQRVCLQLKQCARTTGLEALPCSSGAPADGDTMPLTATGITSSHCTARIRGSTARIRGSIANLCATSARCPRDFSCLIVSGTSKQIYCGARHFVIPKK